MAEIVLCIQKGFWVIEMIINLPRVITFYQFRFLTLKHDCLAVKDLNCKSPSLLKT